MRTVFNLADRLELSRRLDALVPTPRRAGDGWTVRRCWRTFRTACGWRSASCGSPRKGPGALRLPPIRHAVIHWLPFPKGAPTAPELVARRATDCQAECADLKHLLERLAAMEGAREWPEHPAFGRLNSRDWGTLVHRHVDHHLRQFGA